MKNLMKKIFVMAILMVLVLGGCATTNFGPSGVVGRSYSTSALEASLAEYNYSMAAINKAVAEGKIAPERAAELMEVLTPVGPGQKKTVDIHSSGQKSDFDQRADALAQIAIQAGQVKEK